MLPLKDILKVQKFESQYGESEGCFSPRYHQDVENGRIQTVDKCRKVFGNSDDKETAGDFYVLEQAPEGIMINAVSRKLSTEEAESLDA